MATADHSFGLKQPSHRYASWKTVPVRLRSAHGRSFGGRSLTGADYGLFSTKMTLFLMLIVSVATALSGYLAWVGLTSSKIAGCGGQLFDCNHVLQSKWSLFGGIPVGVWATGLYFTLFASLVVSLVSRTDTIRRYAGEVLTFGGLSAGLAAIWFVALQVFAVGHLCAYCLAAHICGVLLAASVLCACPFRRGRMIRIGAVSLLAVAILATGQLIAKAPATFQIENHPSISPISNDGATIVAPGSDDLFSAPAFNKPDSAGDETRPPVFEAPSKDELQKKSNDKLPVEGHALHVVFFLLAANCSGSSGMVLIDPQAGLTGQDEVSKQHQKSGQGEQDSDSSNDSENQETQRVVSVFGGKIRLDVAQWPLDGNQNAKYVFVEMFDYTCPHCRANHRFISEAKQELGDDLAVITFSVPMCRDCNDTVQATDPSHAEACELSKLAIAVWRTSPSSFPAFHEWLMTGEVAPNFATAKRQADEMVDPDELVANLDSELPAQYVAKQVELYKMVGAGTVPKLLFSGTTVTGNIGSTEKLIEVISQQPADDRNQ